MNSVVCCTMAKTTEAEVLSIVQKYSPTTAKQIGDEVGITRQAARNRCENLVRDEKLERVEFDRDVAYTLSNEVITAESETLRASNRSTSDDFAFDIKEKDSTASMLVQGSPAGYKFDVWWDNGKRQSCVHFLFGEQKSDYPHDNRHDRCVSFSVGDDSETIIAHDADPRAENVGYDGATMYITRVEDGFEVRVEWEDEHKEEYRSTIIAPTVDPRIDRDRFYEIEEQNVKEMAVSI